MWFFSTQNDGKRCGSLVVDNVPGFCCCLMPKMNVRAVEQQQQQQFKNSNANIIFHSIVGDAKQNQLQQFNLTSSICVCLCCCALKLQNVYEFAEIETYKKKHKRRRR